MSPLFRTLTDVQAECAVFDRDGVLAWRSPAAAERCQDLEPGRPISGRWPLLAQAVAAVFEDGEPREISMPAARVALFERQALVMFASKQTAELEMFAATSAQLAHDMRNPLAGMMAALTVLGQRMAPPEQSVAVQTQHSLERLSRLIDQLLLFSRPIAPNHHEADLSRIVGGAFEDVRREYPSLELQSEGLEVTVPGDKRLLRHCFRNLFTNAAQMMPNGGSLWVEGVEQAAAVRVDVEDDGPGLAPDVLPRVFEPFFSTRSAGHGLGLTVAARIAEAHGGRVAASFGRRRGARFSVELPNRR